MLKKFIIFFLPLIDLFIFVAIFFTFPILFIYTKLGSRRLPLSRDLFKLLGVYPLKDHYYQPLFNEKKLKLLDKKRHLPGIDFNINYQINFLKELNYSDEIISIANNDYSKNDYDSFKFNNGSFLPGDADFLYSVIRKFRPRKIIEIGSGYSTIIANKACKKNDLDFNFKTEHLCIEPYEQPWLEKLDVEVKRDLVENISLNLFKELNEHDLLFIDSSHMIRRQGDVLYEYLEILPILNKGVIVHIHDIFTPRDYPLDWLRKDTRFWNEQYILESLLSNQKRYKIIAALNYLKNDYFNELKKVCPMLKHNHQPGSIYLKVDA